MFNFANKMLNALVGNEEGNQSGARPTGPQGIQRPQGQGQWMGGPGSGGTMSGSRMPGQNMQSFGAPGMSSLSGGNMQSGPVGQMGITSTSMSQNIGSGTSGQGMGGPGMGGPGMGVPGISGQGMSGQGMSGQGMSGPGMSGPGMVGTGLGGTVMGGPVMSGPGGMNRPPNMMGNRPPQHGPMNPMGRGGPPRPGMGPGIRGMPPQGMPPGGPRGPGGPGMMSGGIMSRPGMGPMGPRGPMSMNGHSPRPIRPGIPGQSHQMTPGGMMMGQRPTIVEPISSPQGGPFGQKIPDPMRRYSNPHDQKPTTPVPGAAKNPNVDLSELSAEEREIIENVMAKAQEIDGGRGQKQGYDPQKDIQSGMIPTKCAVCRTQDSLPGQNCIDCHASVCKGCGEIMPAIENKRQGLVCVSCANHRKSIVTNVHQLNQTVPNYQLNQSQSQFNQSKQQSLQGFPMNAQQQNAAQLQQPPQSQHMQNQQIHGQQLQNQYGQQVLGSQFSNQHIDNQPLQSQQTQNQSMNTTQQLHNQQIQNQQLQNQQLHNQQVQNQQLTNQPLQNSQQQLQNQQQNPQLQNQQLANQPLQNSQQQIQNQQNSQLQNQNLQNQTSQVIQNQQMHQHPMQQQQNQSQQLVKDTKYTPFQHQMEQITLKSEHDGREAIDEHGNISQQANLDNYGQPKTATDYRRGQLRSQTSMEASYIDRNTPGMFRGPADGQDNKVLSQIHGMPQNQAQISQFQNKPGQSQINHNVGHQMNQNIGSTSAVQQGLANQSAPSLYVNNVMQNVPINDRQALSQQTQNYNQSYAGNSQNQVNADNYGQNITQQKFMQQQKLPNELGGNRNQQYQTTQQENPTNVPTENYINKQYNENNKNMTQNKQDPLAPIKSTSQDTYSSNQIDPYYQNQRVGLQNQQLQQNLQHGQQNPQNSQSSNISSQQNFPSRSDAVRMDKPQQASGFGGIGNFLGLQKGKTETDEATFRQQNPSQFGNDPHEVVGGGPQNIQNSNYQNNFNQVNLPQSGNQQQTDQYQNMYSMQQVNNKNQGSLSTQQQITSQQIGNQQVNNQSVQSRNGQQIGPQVNPHQIQTAPFQQRATGGLYQDINLLPDSQRQLSPFVQNQQLCNNPSQSMNYQNIDNISQSYNPNIQQDSSQQTAMYSNQAYNQSQLQPTNLAVQHGQIQPRTMPLSPTDPKQMLAQAGLQNRIRQTSPMAFRKSRGGLKPDVGETWPGSVHLSPIMDVSPSIEMAEQANQGLKQDPKLFTNQCMSTNQQINQNNQQQSKSSISGMLSDFTKALGLSGTSPKEENKLLIDQMGTGIHAPVITGMQQNMGPGMQQTIGTGVQQTIGTGMQQCIGTRIQHGIGSGMQQTIGTGMQQGIGARIQHGIGPGIQHGIGTGIQPQIGPTLQHQIGTTLQQTKSQQKLINSAIAQENIALNQNYSGQNMNQSQLVLNTQNQALYQQPHIPQSSEHNILNQNYVINGQQIGNKTADLQSIQIPSQVFSTTMVNQAGQPVVVQQIAPGQPVQLQQPKVHQQQNLKTVKSRDQTNSLLQQQVLMQQMQQDKIAQQNSRKDILTGTISGVQQVGNKLGIFTSSIPTAALLSQSTLATSDSKQRTSESPLASLQRSQIARQASLDGTSTGLSYNGGILGNARSSSSMTNLNNISKASDIILPTRPGSALGLLRSKAGSTGVFSTSGPQLKTGLPTCIASLLPPDLHHLIYTNSSTYSSTEALLASKLRDELKSSGSNDRRALLEAELRKIQEERRRNTMEKERETEMKLRSELDRLNSINYAGPLSVKQRNEIQRRLGMNATISPLTSSPKLKRRGHYRQMSDPKIFSSISPLRDERHSSSEYLRSHWDSPLRLNSKSNYLEEEDVIMGRQAGFHSTLRRSSESGLATEYWDRSLTPNSLYEYSMGGMGKHKHGRKPRKPRSWHPSPYASDDDDDMYSREEKKQRIKAEIARRRQQIEENARLHEELLRLARLRENAEHGYYDVRGINFDHSPTTSAKDSTSVLRSIDEILREVRDPSTGYYGHSNYKQRSPTSKYGGVMAGHRTSPRHYYGPHGQAPRYPLTEEDKSIARLASTFQPPGEFGEYNVPNYGRITDISPLTVDSINDYTPAMPLLPDMPTRSRKLLEDLGSSPFATQNQRDAPYYHQRSHQEMLKRRDYPTSSMMNPRANIHSNQHYSNITRKIERGTSLEHLNVSRPQHYYSHDHLEAQNISYQRRWSDDYNYGARYTNPSWNNPSSYNYDKYGDGLVINSPSRNIKPFNGRDDMARFSYDQDRRLHYPSGQDVRDSRHDYYDNYEVDNRNGYYPDDIRLHHNERKISTHNPNLRRICLTRDPKDKKISGNGLGMKVIGGKEIPNTNGRLGAYIAKITPGGVVATLGEFKEGDLIVEWNGISLLDKTHEETQKVLNQTADEVEVEIAIRNDVCMLRSSSSNNKSNNNRGSSMHNKQLEENDHLKVRDRLDRNDKSHRTRPPLEDRTTFSNLDYNANESSKLAGTSGQMNCHWKDQDLSEEYYRERLKSNSDKENQPRKDRYSSLDEEHQYNISEYRCENSYNKDQEYRGERGERSERRRRRRRSFDKDFRQKSFDDRNQPIDRQLGGNIMDDQADSYGMTNDVRRHDTYDRNEMQRHTDRNDRNPNHVYDDYDGRRLNDESRRHIEGDNQFMKDDYKNSGSMVSGKDKKISRGQSESREHSNRSHRSHHTNRQRSKNNPHHKSSTKTDPNQPPMGMIELQVCYDITAKILYVTVIRAKGLLTLRDDGGTQPDPFVKVYLLPGRSIENQRRTRYFTNTSTPDWNQTMVYPNLQASDFKKRYLEVTAWSYAKNKPNEFLGETVLDLSDPSVVDEDPKWYQLQEMVETENS